jgi:hypothetical protein
VFNRISKMPEVSVVPPVGVAVAFPEMAPAFLVSEGALAIVPPAIDTGRRLVGDRDVTLRGGMAEWLKALAWKACIRETVSWVRIPLPPPKLRT